MKITIDSNIFIDLLKADETAIRLLNILCDNKEDFHWILHKRQLDEIILVAGRVVDEFPEGEERDNAADFLHYMERLRSVLLQSPEKGNTYRTTFGDPTAPTEPGRNAKLAIDIAANLRREDPDWITEITDSIIVTHTMLEHGSLFSRDKAHIEPMVAKIRQIQSELEILPPACTIIGHRTNNKFHFGFQTGDIVQATIPTGKNKGTHFGRVLCRKSGNFDIKTQSSKIGGVSYKFCKSIQKADGYAYYHS